MGLAIHPAVSASRRAPTSSDEKASAHAAGGMVDRWASSASDCARSRGSMSGGNGCSRAASACMAKTTTPTTTIPARIAPIFLAIAPSLPSAVCGDATGLAALRTHG